MPLMLGLIFFEEYMFIILCSVLLFYSTKKLANALKLNEIYVYILTLNVYLLTNGFVNGTEILSFILFEFGLAYLINKKSSGGFFGLAFLARYTMLPYLAIIFFHKNIKKILINFLYAGGVIGIFLIYDYLTTGNFLTSIGNAYALNVHFRENSIDFILILRQLFELVNILLPFFLMGLIVKYKDFFSKKKEHWIMISIIVIGLYSYLTTPVKDIRYLFNLILPVIYFSYYGVVYCEKILKTKNVIYFVLILNLIFGVVALDNYYEYDKEPRVYEDAINSLEENGLSNCPISSNGWVMLNYLGLVSKASPREELIEYELMNNQTLVYFYHIPEPEYVGKEFFEDNVVYTNEDFIILSKGCGEVKKLDETYLMNLNQSLTLMDKWSISTNPCDYVFKISKAREICKKLNH